MASRVAGERLVLPGKIDLSVFPAEISNFDWKVSSFFYRKTSSRTFRLLEPSAFKIQSTEIRKLFSSVSLITEIVLD
jgi:hypothetical protein